MPPPLSCRATSPPCSRTTQPVLKSTLRGLSSVCGTPQVITPSLPPFTSLLCCLLHGSVSLEVSSGAMCGHVQTCRSLVPKSFLWPLWTCSPADKKWSNGATVSIRVWPHPLKLKEHCVVFWKNLYWLICIYFLCANKLEKQTQNEYTNWP